MVFQDGWEPLRTRERYKNMRDAVNTSLDDYWVTASDPKILPSQHSTSCEQVMLLSFRLLKYIRREYGGLNHWIDDRKIGDMNDAACGFYSLGDGPSTSFQEESDVLEILSRTAFREMKDAEKMKRLLEDE